MLKGKVQCRERKAPLRHPTLGTKLGKISPEQLLGTVHHSAGSSRATAHLQTSKTSASMPLRSEEAACQPTKLLLSSRRGKKRSWGAELATAQRAGLSPNPRIPTSPREGNKYDCVRPFSSLVNNKITAPPCWILASGFSLPLPHCCHIMDGPRWLHQRPSSASTTSPDTQAMIANVRVLKRWMHNTEHDASISNKSHREAKLIQSCPDQGQRCRRTRSSASSA